MSIANLEVLRISFELPNGIFFHDDGFVRSVVEQQNALCAQYGTTNPTVYEMEEYWGGLIYFSVPKEDGGQEMHYHIHYVDRTPVQNIRSRVHEEGEFLIAVDRVDLLEDKIRTEMSASPNLRSYGSEVVAEMAAIAALKDHGFDSRHYQGFMDFEHFPIALKVLHRATGLEELAIAV